jgi:hypothetical protein
MSAPFRIERPDVGTLSGGEEFKHYLERLLKMIPGEIVGVYMIGSGFLPPDAPAFMIGWPVVCLILLIILRIYGTAEGNDPWQRVPVFVAAGAFVLWIFWLGGPFELLQVPYRENLASLAVAVWSFVIPIFYKGPPSSA